MTDDKRSSLYLHLKEIRERFENVDRENRGYIDCSGLREMISDMEDFDPDLADDLMDKLDRDKDGKVTLDDFQTLYTVEREELKKPTSTTQDDSNSSLLTQPNPAYSDLDSPDLSIHARSLEGTVFQYPPLSEEPEGYNPRGDNEGYEIIEELSDDSEKQTIDEFVSPNLHSFYGVVRKELKEICMDEDDDVSKDHIIRLADKLGLDNQDRNELMATWNELSNTLPSVSIENICISLQEREKIDYVSSEPSLIRTKEGWNDSSFHFESPQFPKQRSSPFIREKQHNEDTLDGVGWTNASDYSFNIGRQRPSSAREGTRLSRGYSEGGLRSTVVMHNINNEYTELREKYDHIVDENDALKSINARIEEEKKRLISEGEESIQLFQRRKEEEIEKLKTHYQMSIKEHERSLMEEQQVLQENMERETNKLREMMSALRSENEKYREDVKYYEEDNKNLIDDLQDLRREIKRKNDKIAKLQEIFGIQIESQSETDLEREAAHMREIEKNLEDVMEHNRDLQGSIRDLEDKVDELKEENENLKLQVVEEKRKSQRKQRLTTPGGDMQREKIRKKLPKITSKREILAGEEVDFCEGETPSAYSTDEAEDINTISSASLLEEIRVEDNKEMWGRKISALEMQRSALEANCNDLMMKLQSLEESKSAMREQLEKELKRKTYEREGIDKRLSDLRKIRDDITQARKTLHTSEDVLSQYMLGYENDMERNIADRVAEEADNRLKMEEMEREIKSLKDNMLNQETELKKEIDRLSQINNELHKQMGEMEREGKDEINNLKMALVETQETVVETKREVENYYETNEALKQQNLELHSQLLIAQNYSDELEVMIEASNERGLEMKNYETSMRLAIHDLAQKEKHCDELQEKVEGLEKELRWVKDEGKREKDDLIKERDNMAADLAGKTEEIQQLKQEFRDVTAQLEKAQSSGRYESSPINRSEFISPTPLSPGIKSMNSSTGQSEIVAQMKGQLEDLQKLLITKGNEDVCDSEMSVINELLLMNTALEDAMLRQQRWYDGELEVKNKLLTHVRMALNETCNEVSSDSTTEANDKIATMCDRLKRLSSDVESIQTKLGEHHWQLGRGDVMSPIEEVDHEELACLRERLSGKEEKIEELESSLKTTMDELNESARQRTRMEQLTERQKSELEMINFYLGKAKVLEMRQDKDIEETEKQLKERENDLQIKIDEILRLREQVDKISSTEGLANDEEEQSVLKLLKELYGEVVDSINTDADYVDMMAAIRDKIDCLNDELIKEREMRKECETKLEIQLAEFDQLYNEHEDEINGIAQHKTRLASKLASEQERAVIQDRLILDQQSDIDELKRNKSLIEEALHTARTQKMILIDTIRTLTKLSLNGPFITT